MSSLCNVTTRPPGAEKPAGSGLVPFVGGVDLDGLTENPTDAGSPVAAGAGADAPARLGQRVGRYRLLRMLGRGGTGAVYEAIHTRIGQRVAIKVLNTSAQARVDALQQASHEAWAVSQVRHPGLVRISDSGRTRDGAAYLVMDLLDGESLYDRLQRRGGALTPHDAVQLLRQAASVLAAAHAGGVLHLDLKPENLFVCFDPEVPGGARIKLLDFGLAQVSTVRAQGLHGLRAGTPLYMAKEQWLGGTLWPQTDVYALGVILFQTLTGRPPFFGRNADVLRVLHCYSPPPLLRGLRQDLPGELDGLLARMLDKELQRRPSAGQVAACLQRVGEVLSAQSLPPPPRVEGEEGVSAAPTLIEAGTEGAAAAPVTAGTSAEPASGMEGGHGGPPRHEPPPNRPSARRPLWECA